MMQDMWKRTAPTLLLAGGIITAVLVYLPGLHGSWLVDDFYNLGMFNNYQPGAAPYREIIFHNQSGPLGRSVAMASFAANHALGLFSTPALKATNVAIHAANGLLLYFLLLALLQTRAAADKVPPRIIAAGVAVWWLLLPMHISAVLYIVQRMALLAATFSLGCMLAYVHARRALQEGRNSRGLVLLALSLLVLFPAGCLTKESALSTPAWIVLIEVFFFQRLPAGRLTTPFLLGLLVACTLMAGVLLVWILPVRAGYLWRDFTLQERLLTEVRVIWSYICDIFLPNSSHMGLLHDDYPLSRSLVQPWTTSVALAALGLLVTTAIRVSASRRWWAASFGILFYLSGHLIESTIVSLEIYFEHRNYLPSAGLILAAAIVLLEAWPGRRQVVLALIGIYLALLAFSCLERTQIWGDKGMLMTTSAINHPHSLRAWTDYVEELVSEQHGGRALEAAALAARNNPDAAGIFYLQMVSIYCRSEQASPAPLVAAMATGITHLPDNRPSLLMPLSIGLDYVLTRQTGGHCGNTDFAPLAPALIRKDADIRQRYGAARRVLWLLRLNMAEWLLQLDRPADALDVLRDTWRQDNKEAMPMVGLTLANALSKQGDKSELQAVLRQLAAVTADAPPDFRAELTALHHSLQTMP